MKFEYSGFKLRRAIPADAKGFIEISHDPDVMLYYGEGDGVCKTGESAAQQIKWCNEEFKRNAGRWIIIEKGRDEYIGDIGFSGYVARHKRAEIGYRLMKAFWGRGIITALIGQLLEWGFGELGYNRVEAMVDVRNPASAKVLEKNGFICEGTLREYELESDGFVSLQMYSVLRSDLSAS